MLNRHPDIAMCRETGLFHYVYSRRRVFGDLREMRNRQRLVREWLSLQRVKRMRLDLQALETKLLEEATSYEAFFTTMLAFPAEAQGKTRCGEKTPHTLFIETLWEWYPDATVMHLLRDPRDVVASLQQMPWAADSVLTNARVWLKDNLRARRWRNHAGYLQVRYEELVKEPQEQLRRVCAAIGADYAASMLVPAPDPTADRPWLDRAEEPVTTERSGKWCEQLTAREAALIEWVVGPRFGIFGYAPSEASAGVADIAGALAFAAFDSVRRWIGEFPGGWLYVTRSAKLSKEEAVKDRFRFRHLTQRLEN
jgi:hypothetical protein